jgi:DNA-binding CsgD family transcriptional regulator
MGLTPREHQVLQMLADGKSPKEIANRLGVCRDTVTTYIRSIKDKPNAASREEAVAHGAFIGLVSPNHISGPSIPSLP